MPRGDIVARGGGRRDGRLLLLGLRPALLASVRDLLGEVNQKISSSASASTRRRPPWPPSPPWSWARASFGVRKLLGLWGRLVLLQEPLGKDGHGLLGKHEEQRNVVGGAHIAASLLSLGLGPALLARVGEDLLLQLVQRRSSASPAGASPALRFFFWMWSGGSPEAAVLDLVLRGLTQPAILVMNSANPHVTHPGATGTLAHDARAHP